MIIKIEAYENGGHANQSTTPKVIPEGWAVVPDNMEIPSTFPFVDIEVEGQRVTAMMAGVVPEPEPEPEPAPEYVTYDALAAAIREGVNSVD